MSLKQENYSIVTRIVNGDGGNHSTKRLEEERARTRIISFVTAVFVSLIVLIIFTIPAYRNLREAQMYVSITAEQLERAGEISDAYDDLHATVGRNADAIAKAERALPSIATRGLSDIPERLAVIETIAVREAGGVLIENLDVAPSDQLEQISSIPGVASRRITIEGLAGIDSFKRFMGAVRKSLSLMDPVSADISYANEGVITFTLSLDGYVLTR